MTKHFSIFVFVFFSVTFVTQAQQPKKYIKTPAGFLMILQQGDSVIQEIENVTKLEKIKSANFTAIGFVNVVFGFFDSQTKQYMPKEFRDVEMASMLGSVAWKGDLPSIHTHGVIGDRNFNAYGGHILKAAVSTGSLEIMITVHDKRLQRKRNETLGADVLSLD